MPAADDFVMHGAWAAMAGGMVHISEQVKSIEWAVIDNPGLAFDLSKTVVESACRTILSERKFSFATDADLPNRLVFLMVNEAARCLEEEVIDSPEDADFGMILGTGFAPFRGGPLRFAEHFGIAKVVQEMNRLAQIDEKFAPCELLQKHARAGTRFYE